MTKEYLLKIIPKKIDYFLDNYTKNLYSQFLEEYIQFDIDGFNQSIDSYTFLLSDRRQLYIGIFLSNIIVTYSNNIFYCNCNTLNCNHIGFIILFFTGKTGLICYLSIGYLDNQHSAIFEQNITVCYNIHN